MHPGATARRAHLDAQHALGAEDVARLLAQQVAHEGVEAVLVQRAARRDAHAAHAALVVQLLAPPLGLLLRRRRRRRCRLGQLLALLNLQLRALLGAGAGVRAALWQVACLLAAGLLVAAALAAARAGLGGRQRRRDRVGGDGGQAGRRRRRAALLLLLLLGGRRLAALAVRGLVVAVHEVGVHLR